MANKDDDFPLRVRQKEYNPLYENYFWEKKKRRKT
jgi:hypothetical protein